MSPALSQKKIAAQLPENQHQRVAIYVSSLYFSTLPQHAKSVLCGFLEKCPGKGLQKMSQRFAKDRRKRYQGRFCSQVPFAEICEKDRGAHEEQILG